MGLLIQHGSIMGINVPCRCVKYRYIKLNVNIYCSTTKTKNVILNIAKREQENNSVVIG